MKCKKKKLFFVLVFVDKFGCFFRNELYFIVKGYVNVLVCDMVKILSDVSDDDYV